VLTSRVFVSHTSDMAQSSEGRSFVQAVLDAVSRAGMVPVDMRYFAARDGKPAEFCRQRVRECEIYVAVIGFRYGSMVPGEAVSYTELEFNEASSAGLPRLVFLLDDTAGLPPRRADADRGAVEGFRQRLRDAGLVVRGFTSDASLELEVFHALTDVTGKARPALPLGRHGEVIGELRQLADVQPLRERLHALLMLALYRDSRQARQVLVEELGTEPGPELRQLHQQILAADPALAPTGPATAPASAGAPTGPALRQLPAAVAGFTGRAAELRTLARLLGQAGAGAPGTVVISAIGGTAGVGKTALALHWAHQIAAQFGDGQLYVNLRGFDPSGTPASPAEAIRGFLDALGVPPERIPASSQAQASLYRSLLADRRILIVADNAHDEQQVRPLLPASPGSLVIVTSRNQLSGLAAADGARLLTLDILTHDDAVQLLTARLGSDRAAAEPAAVDQIADLCACLPLALAVAAARAAARSGLPLTALAAELRDSASRLDALDAGDPAASMRAVFSWSYQQLIPGAAWMFRLLGLHPGPEITAAAAASLAGVDPPETRRLLRELTRCHLLAEQAVGRYALHDLLRAYAAEQAAVLDSHDDRQAASGRMLDHYLHTAHAAAVLINGARGSLDLSPARPGTVPERLDGHEQAMAWFTAEHQVLLSVIALAAEAGFDGPAWQLPWTLADYLPWQGQWDDLVGIQHIALAATERLSDTEAQAKAHLSLGRAFFSLRSWKDARKHMSRALELYVGLGDRVGQARCHINLGKVAERLGQHRGALSHARQALTLFDETGNRAGQARALNNVGWYHALLGDHDQALTRSKQALVLQRELGDRCGEANTWDTLGYSHHHLGQHVKATSCYQRAASLFRELGDHCDEADVLIRLGDNYQAVGELAQGREAWQQALFILENLQLPHADTVRAKLASTNDHASRNPST
jgi:tetratricopeptide (TPR) repeat protein